jgi:hypothetical protein
VRGDLVTSSSIIVTTAICFHSGAMPVCQSTARWILWKPLQLRNTVCGHIHVFGEFINKIKPLVSKELSHCVGPVVGWLYQHGSWSVLLW